MVIFEADGDSKAISFHYGIGEDFPPEDSNMAACYDTSIVDNGDGTITFTATRPLECTGITNYGGGSYVVQLDTEISLCMAWNPNKGSLSFHDNNANTFSQMLTSDGTCSPVVNAINHTYDT